MIDFNLILQNEQIILRPVIQSDLDSFSTLTADPSTWIYFTSDLSVKSELEKWVDTAINQTTERSRLAFTIINKAKDEIVGSTSLGNISVHDKRIEIGWTWLGKQHQGKGINDRAKHLLFKYCFDVLDFERVECKTDVLNIAARKALVKVGMTEEGVLRSHMLMTHGRRRDSIYYSILKSEWKELKAKNNL